MVLAAGALGTPVLLRRSGLARGLPQLGRNLSVHPAVTVGALMSEPVWQRRYVPQSLGVTGTRPRGFVLENYGLPFDSIAMAVSASRRDLDRVMASAERFASFSAFLVDPPRGSLRFARDGSAVPAYFLERDLVGRFKEAVTLLAETFLRAGAREVFAPVRGHEKLSSRGQLQALREAKVRAGDLLSLSAHHPLGTCRMGSSPRDSVASVSGNVWGIPGLYVADGSAIPGPLGVNPQVTIMANAIRVARRLGRELGG